MARALLLFRLMLNHLSQITYIGQLGVDGRILAWMTAISTIMLIAPSLVVLAAALVDERKKRIFPTTRLLVNEPVSPEESEQNRAA